MINNKNKLIMTSIIAMTFLIGFTANEAYAGQLPCQDDCTISLLVHIDIKPGSDPNSINTNSMGLVPVAILTTDNFDAKVDVLDAKVDVIDDKVDALGNSGVQRVYVTLKRDKIRDDSFPIFNNKWIIKLRCPASDLSCGPMKVDILHFTFPHANDAAFKRICVDAEKSCTSILNSIFSIGPIPIPLSANTILGANVFIKTGHRAVDAYIVQVETFDDFAGDVMFGAIIPDGATISSPTHEPERTIVCTGNNPCN